VAAIVLAGGLIWGFLAGRTEQSVEATREAPVQAPSRVASKNGETILTFDAAAQRANGIVTIALSRDRRSVETQATGVVLQLQPILDLKTSYNTTSTDRYARLGSVSNLCTSCAHLKVHSNCGD